nr:YdcF family protein [uncultured Draconibacterium sp.]
MTTSHNKLSYIIIFGAAVNTDGEPSGAMKRRVKSAVLASKEIQDVHYLVTGGIGKGKSVSEAEAMKKLLLQYDVPHYNISTENKSHDTLSSVNYCHTILKERNNFKEIFICSDAYHIPRCRWLFYILGTYTRPIPVLSGRQANGQLKWMYYYLRDWIALPYDTLLTVRYRIHPTKH